MPGYRLAPSNKGSQKETSSYSTDEPFEESGVEVQTSQSVAQDGEQLVELSDGTKLLLSVTVVTLLLIIVGLALGVIQAIARKTSQLFNEPIRGFLKRVSLIPSILHSRYDKACLVRGSRSTNLSQIYDVMYTDRLLISVDTGRAYSLNDIDLKHTLTVQVGELNDMYPLTLCEIRRAPECDILVFKDVCRSVKFNLRLATVAELFYYNKHDGD